MEKYYWVVLIKNEIGPKRASRPNTSQNPEEL